MLTAGSQRELVLVFTAPNSLLRRDPYAAYATEGKRERTGERGRSTYQGERERERDFLYMYPCNEVTCVHVYTS